MIIVRIVQFVKIVQLVQLDYYGYIKFFGVFVGTWVGAFTIYLSNESRKAGSQEFVIPFDRQQLADYLNVDRSALSKELGKMRDEGLIEFRKNAFHLHSIC